MMTMVRIEYLVLSCFRKEPSLLLLLQTERERERERTRHTYSIEHVSDMNQSREGRSGRRRENEGENGVEQRAKNESNSLSMVSIGYMDWIWMWEKWINETHKDILLPRPSDWPMKWPPGISGWGSKPSWSLKWMFWRDCKLVGLTRARISETMRSSYKTTAMMIRSSLNSDCVHFF